MARQSGFSRGRRPGYSLKCLKCGGVASYAISMYAVAILGAPLHLCLKHLMTMFSVPSWNGVSAGSPYREGEGEGEGQGEGEGGGRIRQPSAQDRIFPFLTSLSSPSPLPPPHSSLHTHTQAQDIRERDERERARSRVRECARGREGGGTPRHRQGRP